MIFSKNVVWRSLLASLTVGLTILNTLSVGATPFDNQETDQNKFVAFAGPYGGNKYKLFVLQQIANTQACWSESGSSPTKIEPLLLNFDFTGICERSTDSNGYSIRLEGQDLSWQYDLTLVKRNDELVLLGIPAGSKATPLEIGRSYGMSDGYIKIILNQGWRFTKRVYNGQTLGHVYFTQGSVSSVTPVQSVQTQSTPIQPVTTPEFGGLD